MIVGIRRRLAVILSTFVLFVGTASNAEQSQVKIVQSAVESVVPAKEYPWSAIGKLTNGVTGACTAVLIAQHYALTAAHCLFAKHTRRFLPAESLHFILGYENQRFVDHLHVLAYFVPPTYDPTRPFETIASDWALLQISGSGVRPLTVKGAFNAEAILAAAGYSARTPYRMTGDGKCHFVGRSSDNYLLFNTCYAPDGFSGGPILVQSADRQSYLVAGIHVGNQVWQGHRIAIAVSSENIWREIRPCIEMQECYFQHFAGERDPSAAEIFAGFPNLGIDRVIETLAEPLCENRDFACDLSLTASRRR